MRSTTPALVAAVALAGLLLAGCGPTGDDSEKLTPAAPETFAAFATDPDVPVDEDLRYGTADGEPLLLDACLPPEVVPDAPAEPSAEATVPSEDPDGMDAPDAPEASDTAIPTPAAGEDSAEDPADDDQADDDSDPTTPVDADGGDAGATLRPAIVMVHGGSWTRGDKADIPWRSTCQWLAKAGYPTFNVDYRLAPAHPYPAAIDDITMAVEWLREPEQVDRFGIDPERIGAFGGSAGGNLVSLLGTRGEGATSGEDAVDGSRVAAVVELSGPVDLTGDHATPDFVPVQLSYLACASEADCPQAEKASAISHIDPTDPPFFVAHSTDERIPLAQSTTFVTKLRADGIDTTFVEVTGSLHSIAMLDDPLRDRILDFYRSKLRGAQPGVVP